MKRDEITYALFSEIVTKEGRRRTLTTSWQLNTGKLKSSGCKESVAGIGLHGCLVGACHEEPWAALQEAIQRYGRRERYLVTGNRTAVVAQGFALVGRISATASGCR